MLHANRFTTSDSETHGVSGLLYGTERFLFGSSEKQKTKK